MQSSHPQQETMKPPTILPSIRRYSHFVAIFSGYILLAYLFVVRLGIYWPTAIFWGALFLILSISVYKVITTSQVSALYWVFPLTILTVWSLKTLFVPVGVPFFGSDPYVEQAATLEIAQVGWLDLSPWKEGLSRLPNSTNYPLLSILDISLSELVGLSSTTWERWAMPAISLISLLFVHGISLELYRSKRVALLSTIGFGFTYMYLMFHSLYLRETLAFIFFLGTIYTFIKGRSAVDQRSKILYRLSSMAFIIGIVLSHHFSSLMLLFFGAVLAGVYWVRNWLAARKWIEPTADRRDLVTLWLFLLVTLFAYWTYLRYSPLIIVRNLVEDATSGVQLTSFSLPATSRYYIVLFNQMATTLAFGLLAVIGLFRKENRNILQLTAVIWGGLAGAASFLFAVAAIPGTTSLSNRFELFGYIFLIPAASGTVIWIFHKRRWLGIALGLIFVLYGLNNIYRFPLYLYTQKQPDFVKREVRALPLREEYQLVRKINPQAKIASDLVLSRWIRPRTAGPVEIWFRTNPSTGKNEPNLDFDFLILGERELHLLAANFYGQTPEDLGLNKIYSAGFTAIYTQPLDALGSFDIREILGPPPDEGRNRYPDFITWMLLTIEILTLIALAYLVALQFDDISRANLATGFGIVMLLIFVLYLGANLIGYKSPGLLLLLLPMALIFWGIRHSLSGKINLGFLLSVGLFGSLVFGYGLLVDRLSLHQELDAYTEFYVQSILPCDENVCVNLYIANHEGRPMHYRVDGFIDSVTLHPEHAWEGTLVVPQTREDALLLNLIKSPNTRTSESLLLRVKNSSE
jgi:hypothetical protein